ncbi:hypothetical protein BG000_008447 [Podila horticola]|nr:hypothetical protein BG000_008447 [Podila horticola]
MTATVTPMTYNILFLGESQSGKSALIESLRRYADPSYIINKDNLGNGIFSKTNSVSAYNIHTDLTSYYIINDKGERVDYGAFLDNSHEDYEDELKDRKSYRLKREALATPSVSFRLIDTPGLNDTALNDETNIAIIFKALENIKSIHLVVITIANNPFTEGLRDALQAYVNLLPELNGNIMFLHTKIDYSKLHPDEKAFGDSMTEKQNILHNIMGRDTVPHLLIDNDINSERTIRNCITQNTLRNLLDMAKLNQPIPVRVMVMNKTQKMLVVDSVLRQKCLENIRTREATLGGKDREEQEVLAKIGDLKARIAEHEQGLQDIQWDLAFHDKDALVLYHEESYQQGISLHGTMESAKAMYFPGKARANKSGFIHHHIDHIDILARNVKILQNAGGLGQAFWAARFRRRKHQNGLYVVKIYISKRKKYSKQIEDWKTSECRHRGLLEACNAELADLERQEQERRAQIDELLTLLKQDHYLMSKVSTTIIDSNVFHMLTAAGVYVRDISQSALNVERFYFANKDNLDMLAKVVGEDNVTPVNTSSTTNDEGDDFATEINSLLDAVEFISNVATITGETAFPKVAQQAQAQQDTLFDSHTPGDTFTLNQTQSVREPLELITSSLPRDSLDLVKMDPPTGLFAVDSPPPYWLVESNFGIGPVNDPNYEEDLGIGPANDPNYEKVEDDAADYWSTVRAGKSRNPETVNIESTPTPSRHSQMSTNTTIPSIPDISGRSEPQGPPKKLPRPHNPFLIYRREQATKYTGLKITSSELTIKLAEAWRHESPDTRAHYVRLAEQAKADMYVKTMHKNRQQDVFGEAQDYIIDQSLLGDGTFSKTDTTRSFQVKSGLPSYEAFIKRTGQVINLKDLGVEHKDDEDYQDLLLSSETDVGLRLAPESHDKPLPVTVEFEFVDTPGLCNHEDKDSSHALAVFEKIVATRFFSLVLIVVNPHDPLSAELLLALQYYAEILGDLRNKIAFVFTHVDYLHSRLNTNQNLALEEKACSLSRIFKGSAAGDFEPYPSFAIDLSQKKRPVVQCMIRNTLKEILLLAISHPVTMVNTSTENVQRVKRIPHPSNFDNKKRKAALDRIYGEPEPRSKVNTQEKKTSRRSTPEDVNILLIGDVQSGKTSLVETMKMYAEAGSVTNEELAVGGRNSIADEIIQVTSFAAELYTLEIRALSNGRHHFVNIEEHARTLHRDAFDSLLNMGKGNVNIRHIRPSVSKEYRFAVFEAPGFGDAEDLQGLQRKVLAIYRAIVESQTDIHHILVTLAPDSITTITKAFIALLTEMFVNIQPHISFVHTKIDYSQLHFSNQQFHNSVEGKNLQLHELLQTSPPNFMIDNGLYADRPIKRAISQNAVRNILQTTMLNRPDCSVLTLVKPKYSVLVLGQTQSGKSTLVQHIKKYANPAHEIDQSFLGNGNVSKTLSTIHFFIDSNLPAYEVLRKNDGSIVNLQNLQARFENEEDYLKLIAGREKDYTLRISQDPQSLPSQLVEFQFLDTPGLNDTDQRDTVFADNIIEEIINTRSFNLILIIVSAKCSLSKEFGFALEYYSNVLEGLHANIAFLHTHVDYANCHYSKTEYHDNMATRHEAFSNIFRHRAYTPNPHKTVGENSSMEIDSAAYQSFTIDLHVGKRPIIQCLIRNTLREILRFAVANFPVDVDTSEENIARIKGLVHPDKANQEYRERFREANPVAMPQKQQDEGGDAGGSSQSWPAV